MSMCNMHGNGREGVQCVSTHMWAWYSDIYMYVYDVYYVMHMYDVYGICIWYVCV